ncbi:MATE family efflux transporter [Spirochaetia bacterium]|nr:MATE family efflux transporter [Spirochaetia bacterium]
METVLKHEDSKFEKMTTWPVEKLVCQLAIPSIIIMLVSAMYNTADTFFVGALGTSATAAVGISFSFMAIIQALGFFFGHGSGNYISRALGAQNNADAGKMAATGFFTAFGAGCLIAVGGTIFLIPLARLLGATDTILPHALPYLRFILLGTPFMISSLMLNNLLRFQGNAFWGMIGMISGAVLNIGLDPLFIYVLGMGVAGASLATMISQMVSCVLLLIVSCTAGDNVRIRFRNFSPGFRLYREIIRGGTPSLLRQGLNSLAVIFLNHAAGAYGDGVIAAIAIVNRLVLISSAALLGLGQGFQPVCGFNYGAKHYDRVKRAFWFCMKLTTVLLSLAAIFCFVFAPRIIAFFRKDDAQVIAVGALALRLQCFSFPFIGWIVLHNMMLQTIGKTIPASVLAAARQGLFLIPLLLILPPLMGVLGIQLCAPLSDICTFVLAIPLGLHALREMK